MLLENIVINIYIKKYYIIFLIIKKLQNWKKLTSKILFINNV